MVLNVTPLYLSSLVPPLILSNSAYSTRNSNNFREPFCKTSLYKGSFLPSVVKLWNNIPIDIRNARSIVNFKQKLKNLYANETVPIFFNLNFNYGRLPAIHHTRLRLGVSTLNAHLFPINCATSPYCSCGEIEDGLHYFLECPLYHAQRRRLLSTLTELIAPGLNVFMLPYLDKHYLLHILLFGWNDLSDRENAFVFEACHKYIFESKRF